MLAEKEILKNKLSSFHIQIKNLPEGTLSSAKNGNYHKWYRFIHGERSYIYREERALAEQLAYKKYLSTLSKELENELHAIDAYLKKHSTNPSKALQMLTKDSAYYELLIPYFKHESQSMSDWTSAIYQTNPKHPEQLTHKTISGHNVRSKSESIIDMFLFHNRIPFRYECELLLDNITLYPDFTIRHPVTGQTFYWEHFGMMDDPSYCKNVASKLQLYMSNGIIPSIQLITTYETRAHPLSTSTIENIILEYFL